MAWNKLDDPLHWIRPRRVFVNSMSDLFHEGFDFEHVAAVFGIMLAAPRHRFLVLTKRPERLLWFLQRLADSPHLDSAGTCAGAVAPYKAKWAKSYKGLPIGTKWPPQHIWLGVSIEDQKNADHRTELLLKAAEGWNMFVSCEPMLGPVVLDNRLGDGLISWVICGGESGPKARPMHPDWPRLLRDQCITQQVPFLFKQWGEWSPECKCRKAHECERMVFPYGERAEMFRCGKTAAGRKLDGQIWNQFPRVTDE